MTSTIRDVTKAGVRAETTHVDLIGNPINENGQAVALSLDKLLDLLSSSTDDLGADAYNERVSKMIDDFGKKAADHKGGWGDFSLAGKSGTTATKADLQSSTELSSVKTAGVTDAVAETQSAPADTTAVRSVEAAAAAPAAAAAASSGFPDASTSGVPAGTALKTYTGPMTITKAGTVIENAIINGSLRITADNVVIKNSVIKYSGTWGIDAEGAKNVTIQNNDNTGPGYSGIANAAILGSGNFSGNDISKSENGIVLQGGASTVKGNYIHDLEVAGSDPHYDGISVQGGQNGVLIEGNTVIGRDTSDVFIKNDFGPIANVKVIGNLLLGDSGYPVYVDGRANGGPITGVTISNNHVEIGGYGYYSVENASPAISGNVEYPRNGAPVPGR